jgi:hypothetical protein
MKHILLFIILSLSFNSYSTVQNDSLSLIKIDSLEKRIILLEKTIESNSINNHSKFIISEYKDLNNLYSIGFGILIALFGLVFPVILYLMQIKPAIETTKETKALVKKLDEDFEKSFEEHLRKSKNKLIDQAIENFENWNEHNLSINYNLLETYKSEGFSEIQVIKMLKLVKNKDFGEINKEFLASVLTYQEDSNIEDYFVELIKSNPNDKKCILGAVYFCNYNKTQYYNLISDVVINGYSIVGMVARLSSIHTNFTIGLLNNENLASNHQYNEIKTFCDYLKKNDIQTLTKTDAENTLIWKRYDSGE